MNRQTNQSGQNSRQPDSRQHKKPQRPQTPRSVVIIYIVMLIIILAICAVVFVITLQKTGDSNYSADTSDSSDVSSDSPDISQSSSELPDSSVYSSNELESSSDAGASGSSESFSAAASSDNQAAVSSVYSSKSSGVISSSSSAVSSSSRTSDVVPASSSSVYSQEPVSSSSPMTLLGANMVYVGESYNYSYTTAEKTENNPSIEWECVGSSGTITQSGTFTAVEKGEVTLWVRDNANNLSAKLLVHVVNSAKEVDFVPMVNNIPLVNKTYALPSDYAPGGLTAQTQTAFNKLVLGAAADGLNIYMISGYRSYEKQQKTYLGWCNTYGTQQADRISARPGFSEHQLGMAIDVNSLYESFENTAEGKWLAEHCWEYGFIIRYPKGKESYTGYSYEPWHIRYLGDVELAKKVTESGLCLEEYFGIDSRYRD